MSARIYNPQRIRDEEKAAQQAAEQRPLLGTPISQRVQPIAIPQDITPRPEDTANLALYGVQHILEDNKEDRKSVLCSKICNPQYIEGTPIPQKFSVPSNVENACIHRCHNWTKSQNKDYRQRKAQQALIEAGTSILKKTPLSPAVTIVETGRSLSKAKGLRSNVASSPRYSGSSYGTSRPGGGKSRRKRKTHRKRRGKSRKSRRKRKSKSRKSRRKRSKKR